MERFYAPILAALRDQLEVVGIHGRTLEKARARAAEAGWKAFATLEDLLATNPEAALLAIPPEPREPLAHRLLDRGLHLFLESPVALRPRGAHALARRPGVIEVAEEQAFAPEAELQRAVIASGALGRPLAVVNDGLEYYHHACARLHRLLGALTAARCSGRNLALADGARLEQRELTMTDGTVYLHRYSRPKSHPARAVPDWLIVCERGALTEAAIQREGRELFVTVDGWRHAIMPPHGDATWTRQHHGLATLLGGFAAAIRGAAPLYGVARAARDLELTAAMELAARSPVALPGALACALARWR